MAVIVPEFNSSTYGLGFINPLAIDSFGLGPGFQTTTQGQRPIPEAPTIGETLISKGTKEGIKQGAGIAKDVVSSAITGTETVIGGTGIPAGGFAEATGVPFSGAGGDLATGFSQPVTSGLAANLPAPILGVGQALQAAALPVAVFTGLAMLNRSQGAREFSQGVDLSGETPLLGDDKNLRIAQEHRGLTESKILPEFTNRINAINESGVNLENTQFRVGVQAGDRGTNILMGLVKAIHPDEQEGQAALSEYLSAYGDLTRQRVQDANTARIAAGRMSQQYFPSGELEPPIGFITATDSFGNTQKFNFINVDEALAATAPRMAELAERSKQTAFDEMEAFVSRKPVSVVQEQGPSPISTSGDTVGAPVTGQKLGRFKVPSVTARREQEETAFGRFLRERRNDR